jgi:hypothetical protein
MQLLRSGVAQQDRFSHPNQSHTRSLHVYYKKVAK